MLVNRYCQVVLGDHEGSVEDAEGHRFSTSYAEIVERGLNLPVNDNKLPTPDRIKRILLWGTILLTFASALYFL